LTFKVKEVFKVTIDTNYRSVGKKCTSSVAFDDSAAETRKLSLESTVHDDYSKYTGECSHEQVIQQQGVVGGESSLGERYKQKKILWVEDSALTIRIYQSYSSKIPDLESHFSMSVGDAKTKIIATQYDVIITDYNLEDDTSVDVVRLARERFGNIPILLVTSHESESNEVVELINVGVFYHKKPLNKSTMMTFVQEGKI
jgi:CheY-like chemotaxis protein